MIISATLFLASNLVTQALASTKIFHLNPNVSLLYICLFACLVFVLWCTYVLNDGNDDETSLWLPKSSMGSIN